MRSFSLMRDHKSAAVKWIDQWVDNGCGIFGHLIHQGKSAEAAYEVGKYEMSVTCNWEDAAMTISQFPTSVIDDDIVFDGERNGRFKLRLRFTLEDVHIEEFLPSSKSATKRVLAMVTMRYRIACSEIKQIADVA